MSNSIFSFEGRIGRSEYSFSLIIVISIRIAIEYFFQGATSRISAILYLVSLAIIVWILWAQGAKRCHDIGKSGWFQIIPFFFIVMIFQKGLDFDNQYGINPKNKLPEDSLPVNENQSVVCNNCGSDIELDESEIFSKTYVCPECGERNYLTESISNFQENAPNEIKENPISLEELHNIQMKFMGTKGSDKDIMPEGSGEFGLEVTNPIPPNAIFESYSYLARLRTADGSRIESDRIGSVSAPNIPNLIDAYRIKKDGKEIGILYLCPYNKKPSKIAPKGFRLID